ARDHRCIRSNTASSALPKLPLEWEFRHPNLRSYGCMAAGRFTGNWVAASFTTRGISMTGRMLSGEHQPRTLGALQHGQTREPAPLAGGSDALWEQLRTQPVTPQTVDGTDAPQCCYLFR